MEVCKVTLEEMEYNLLTILYAKTVKWVELVGVLDATQIIGGTVQIFNDVLRNPPSKELCKRLEQNLAYNAKVANVPEYQFDEIDWDMMKTIALQRNQLHDLYKQDPRIKELYDLMRKKDSDFEKMFAGQLSAVGDNNGMATN